MYAVEMLQCSEENILPRQNISQRTEDANGVEKTKWKPINLLKQVFLNNFGGYQSTPADCHQYYCTFCQVLHFAVVQDPIGGVT